MHRLNDCVLRKRRLVWSAEVPAISGIEDAQAPVRSYPDVTVALFQDGRDMRARQAIDHGVVPKLPVRKAADAHRPRSDPHRARMILVDRVFISIGEALLFGDHMDGLALQPVEPVSLGADPQVPLSILKKTGNRDRNRLPRRDELEGSGERVPHDHGEGFPVALAIGNRGRHLWQNRVAQLVRRDPYLLPIKGLDPESPALVDCSAPDLLCRQTEWQGKREKPAPNEATETPSIRSPKASIVPAERPIRDSRIVGGDIDKLVRCFVPSFNAISGKYP